MSIFVSTSCLNGYSTLTELVADLLAAGLNRIELSASPPVTETELARIAMLDAHFLVHNYFPPVSPPFVMNLASQNPAILEASLKLAKRAIDLSASFGSSLYGVHSGIRADVVPHSLGGALKYGSIGDYDSAHKQMVKSLRILCDYAQGRHVAVCVENHVLTSENLIRHQNQLLLYCEPFEMWALIDDVARPNFGVLLDLGHLAVTAATLNFDRWRFVEQVAPKVLAIHVSDNDMISDQHRPLRHGSWVLDVLRTPEFSDLPLVVEAKFETANELACYVRWLRSELGRE